jgi:hypothetical protein
MAAMARADYDQLQASRAAEANRLASGSAGGTSGIEAAKHSTPGWVAPMVIFAAGWYVLPKGDARGYYIWSYLLWAFSAWCIWQLFAMIRNYHRAQAVAVVVEEIAEISEAEHVVSPPATPPPAPHRKTVVVKPGVTDSGLIIPSHTQRRVRHGGGTLSGVPIKDRRATDPHTPGLAQPTSTPEIDNPNPDNKENTP